MKIILDSCTFLWIITDDPKLSTLAKEVYLSPENEVYLSVVSEWEIALKYSIGKLPLPANPLQYIFDQRVKHGVNILPLTEPMALAVASIPFYHNDPFDRMMISQASSINAAVLSPDEHLRKYPVRIIW